MLGFVFTSRLENAEEVIDDFAFSGIEMEENLKELTLFNRFLGGHQSVIDALETIGAFSNTKQKITDIGTGAGDTLVKIAEHTDSEIIGWDANPFIVEQARKNTAGIQNVNIVKGDVTSEEFKQQKQDFLVASLFFHHFSEQEIIDLLISAKQTTSMAIVINDLHRSKIAYHLFRFVTFITKASSATKNDGKLSILKGFTKKEWKQILAKAGFASYSVKWKWAFRHQIIVHCNE